MKTMKRMMGLLLSGLLCAQILFSVVANASEANGFTYENDPRFDPRAMEDINYDPNAWYGFSPDPESDRLGSYAEYDFSDPVLVAQSTKDRIDYMSDFKKMQKMWEDMKARGKSTEEIAKAVSTYRNELRIEANIGNPQALASLKESNLKKYGNEKGPTVESLYAKYGSWEKVLTKSFSTNAGMDACLGLYDSNYALNNLINGAVPTSARYTVKKGDYLSKIARKYYGNTAQWTKIYNANKNLISDPNVIQPGITLEIPID